jgi:peptide/nickel transport system substrate-binding protein
VEEVSWRMTMWIVRLGLALGVLIAACGAPVPSAPTAGGPAPERAAGPKRIKSALMGDPPVLNLKLQSTNVAGTDVLEELTNSGLATPDDRGVLQPQLAEAVPSVENGLWKLLPDGRMEMTWKLRDGVTWHDGAPFTSDDLTFTADVIRDRQVPNFNNVAYNAIESVEAPDATTLVVRWNRPYIYADTLFTRILSLPMPRHLLERPYTDEKSSFTQLPYWSQEFVGTGPFKIREWTAGSHIILDANEAYVLGRPKVDGIDLKLIPDSSTLASNVLAGEVELTVGRNLSLEQAMQTRDLWRDGKMEYGLRGWLVMYPQFLTPDPPVVANPRFRQALLHGTDRTQLAESLQAGLVSAADSFLNPREPDYPAVESNVVKYPYDLRRAAELIEELGYTRASDGFWVDSAGQRLSVEIRSTADNDIHHKSLFAVADYWQRMGINSEPLLIPIQRANDREWRAGQPGFGLQQQPNDLGVLPRVLHSSSAAVAENNYAGSGTSYARYMNPEYDTLLDRYATTIPKSDRVRVLGDILKFQTENVLLMGMFYLAQPSLIGNRLRNVGAASGTATSAWNAYLWDIQR